MRVFYATLALILICSCQTETTITPEKFTSQLAEEEEETMIVDGLGVEIVDTKGTFVELKLMNVSDDTIRLWESWNSWGYYNFSFKLKSQISQFTFKKGVRDWTVNFPSTYYIKPHSDSVFLIDFQTENWLVPQDSLAGNLTVDFEIIQDAETKELEVWRGKVTSKEIPYSWTKSDLLTSEIRKILDKLNQWDKEEMDVYENRAAYPGRVSSGETNGWVETHKALLLEKGAKVNWNHSALRYELADK